jgi:hypothetical protein
MSRAGGGKHDWDRPRDPGSQRHPIGYAGSTEGDHVKNQARRSNDLVVRKIDAGTWSVQKKAVPGFRLSKSSNVPTPSPAAKRRSKG